MPLLAAAILFAASMMWAAPGNRANPEVPFDVNEVLRQASRSGQFGSGSGSTLGSSEFLVDTCSVFSTAGYQFAPAVAFDGTDYLVVWEDYRNEDVTGVDIYGTRVTQGGVLLDSGSIAISTVTRDQYCPAVSFDGANYFVVWEDDRSGNPVIYGTRVAPSGAVLDGGPTGGLEIAPASADQNHPVVAFNGTNYLVVWEDWRALAGIYGARVSPSGAVLDPTGIEISTAGEAQMLPGITSDGANYLVVWTDNRINNDPGIFGVRVSQSGAVLDPGDIEISAVPGIQRSPDAGFDGTNYLVVWGDERSGHGISGARVTRAGVVLDGGSSGGFSVSNSGATEPAVGFDGTNYLVTWFKGHSAVWAARVRPSDALVLDSSGIELCATATGEYSPLVAFDGSNYLVVWVDDRGSTEDIYGARVSPAGTVIDPAGIAISTAANDQYNPAVAFDGTNYFVVWSDTRLDDKAIYGARVAPSGALLDPLCVQVSTGATFAEHPAVAFDGVNYLVVWEDYRYGILDIYGARVSRMGTLLDPTGIILTATTDMANSPAVAFDGANYFVVWAQGPLMSPWDIWGSRVSPAGAVLDPSGIAVSTATGEQDKPALTFDGTNYLVVWEDHRAGTDVYGARVTQAGVLLDTGGIAISAATNNQYNPAVAFDGTNYMAVWEDNRSGTNWDIYGARVRPDGSVVDSAGIAVSTAPNSQQLPAVAFDGSGYVILWQDARSGSSKDIYGKRMSPTGVVTDSFTVVAGAYDQSRPAIARGPGSTQLLAVWQGFAEHAGSRRANTERIWGRFLSSGADVGVARIVAPAGMIDSAASVTPACSTYNGGMTKVSYQVRMRVGNHYDQTGSVTDHMPGTWQYVAFPASSAWERGNLVVKCSTMLGDLDPANNAITGSVSVTVPDIGVAAIESPVGTILPGSHVPQARLHNYGALRQSCRAVMTIGAYVGTVDLVAGLPPGADTAVRFPAWTAVLGNHVARCSTWMAEDREKANDTLQVAVLVAQSGWTAMTSLPLGGKNKNIKDGGALCAGKEPTDANDTTYVYAFKGNNRYEFYRYNTVTGVWVTRESIPATGRSGKKKAVKKGAAMAGGPASTTDGIEPVPWVVKGNGTLEFWGYVPGRTPYAWAQYADVPLGAKAIKEGSGLVAVQVADTEFVYLLKGSGTQEFYRYNATTNTWDVTLPNAPGGLSGKPYKNGSCLAYDGGDIIYCLKGSLNEFAAYSIKGKAWVNKSPLPFIAPPGTRKKKVKDGAGMAYYGNAVYALKGGGTDEFWRFNCADQTWSVQPQLPPGLKKVKGGGALTFSDANKSLYAFRGNNTREFWKYGPLGADGLRLSASGQRKSVQGSAVVRSAEFGLRIAPTPFTTAATITYSLAKPGNVSLKLYDITGKLKATLASGNHPAGEYGTQLTAGRSQLSAGVYLLEYEAGDYRTTEKLVIE
jgi:hypothetical protein